MRVSQKVDYAMRAMLELAQRAQAERPTRSADIAARAEIPEKYLEAILAELARAGLILSRRGPEGGHQLARPAREIRVVDVYVAAVGALRLTDELRPRLRPREGARPLQGEQERLLRPELSTGADSPDVDGTLRGLWLEVEDAVRSILERVTLAELLARARERRNVLDFSI